MSGREDTAAPSRAEAASLLAWWLEAGVDVAVQEEPRDWRRPVPPPAPLGEVSAQRTEGAWQASPKPQAPSAPVGAPPAVGGGAETLDAFHAWLAETSDLPLFRTGAARALPHGPAEAELMLIGGIPGAEDVAEGRPIGGTAWQLAIRMLAAIGLTPDQAYVAAVTCFANAGTRFSEADTAACRETILRQIALAKPKRLLLLGDAPAKLLLDQAMASARGKVHKIAGVPAVVTFPPRHLIQHPQHKPLAWADLLLIMGEVR